MLIAKTTPERNISHGDAHIDRKSDSLNEPATGTTEIECLDKTLNAIVASVELDVIHRPQASRGKRTPAEARIVGPLHLGVLTFNHDGGARRAASVEPFPPSRTISESDTRALHYHLVINLDGAVVDDFGDEWARFDQSELSKEEWERIAGSYFAALPWDVIPPDALAVDVGCGSGRWARWMAPRVGRLVCVDASRQAVQVARRALRGHVNTVVVQASVEAVPVAPGTADIVYSLGVLHHFPDTAAAIADCADLLKPGGVLHLYLYYSFENRPAWFRALWKVSDGGRTLVSRAPRPIKNGICEVIAVTVYWPLARIALLLERVGVDPSGLPLSPYRRMSLYSMRTDARDRFGTRLERRFSRAEITDLLTAAGLVDIRIPHAFPFWIAVARRPSESRGHGGRSGPT